MKYILTILLGVLMTFSGIVSAENSIILESENSSLQISVFEFEAFKAVLNDVEKQKILQENGYESKLLKGERKIYKGEILVDGISYAYKAAKGLIDLYDEKHQLTHTLAANEILTAMIDNGEDTKFTEKNPLVVFGIVVVAGQAACGLTAGSEHAYCRSTCKCGAKKVSTHCVLGYRNTACECYECPEPPTPLPWYPTWDGGGLLPGTTWIDYGGAFEIDDPYSTQ